MVETSILKCFKKQDLYYANGITLTGQKSGWSQ